MLIGPSPPQMPNWFMTLLPPFFQNLVPKVTCVQVTLRDNLWISTLSQPLFSKLRSLLYRWSNNEESVLANFGKSGRSNNSGTETTFQEGNVKDGVDLGIFWRSNRGVMIFFYQEGASKLADQPL